MKKVFIFFINLYNKTLARLIPHHCAYLPSCSNFAKIAINRFGAIKGTYLGIKRIFRCNSKNMGKVDLVPENIKGDYRWLI